MPLVMVEETGCEHASGDATTEVLSNDVDLYVDDDNDKSCGEALIHVNCELSL